MTSVGRAGTGGLLALGKAGSLALSCEGLTGSRIARFQSKDLALCFS